MADRLLKSFIEKLRDDLDYKNLDGFIAVNSPRDLDGYFSLSEEEKINEEPEIRMKINPIKGVKEDGVNGVIEKLKEFRELLLKSRNYKDFLHYKNITSQNNSSKHFIIGDLDSQYNLLDDENNYYKLTLKKYAGCWLKYRVDSENITLLEVSEDLYNKLKGDKQNDEKNEIINLCDLIFFRPKPNPKKALALPLPFTSVPTMVLITTINEDETSQHIKNRITKYNQLTKETRLNFMFNRLLERLRGESIIKIKSDKEFVEWFVIQISEILLPISYKFSFFETSTNFSGDVFKNLVSDCKENKNKVTFSLKTGKGSKLGKLELILKSYFFPCNSNDVDSTEPYQWFHEIETNDKTQKYIVETVENLFLTLYQKFNDNILSEEALKKQTIKASLASIIARGLSHTDGSHSMIYFEKNYEELIARKQFRLAQQQFKQYNKHLREVMELTADITGGIGSQTSYGYNFSEVLRSLNTKVSKENLSVTYFPSESFVDKETLQFKKDYQIRTFLSDAIVDNKFRCCLEFDDESCNKKVLLPGGINSKTALIQILKNIYRNIFKHNSIEHDTVVEDSDLEKVTLSIRIEKPDRKVLQNDYYKLIITEKTRSTNEDKFKKLKKITKDKILNEKGEVDSKAWGIKEIKIQAAYLIALAIEELDEKSNDFKDKFADNRDWYFVKLAKDNENDKFGFIEHHLYLKKEKKALIITGQDQESILNIKKNNDSGIYFKNLDSQKWHKEADKDFEYIVIKSENTKDNAYKSRNFKVLETNQDFTADNISAIDKLWVETYYDNKKVFDSKNLKFGDSHYTDKDLVKKWNNDYFEAIKNEYKHDYEKTLAVNTRIAVLDERLQEYVCKTQNNNIHKINDQEIFERNILEKKGIYIPELNQNLYTLLYPTKGTKNKEETADFEVLQNYLEELFCEEKKDFDYVIIHFSGLEAIANALSNNTIKEYRRILSDELKINFDKQDKAKKIDVVYTYLVKYILKLPRSSKYLILTSGKGTAKTLPNHSFFINLNNLESLIKTKGATKLDFVKTLQSIRQINN